MVEIEFFEIIGTSLGAARRRDPKPCLGMLRTGFGIWRLNMERHTSLFFLPCSIQEDWDMSHGKWLPPSKNCLEGRARTAGGLLGICMVPEMDD